MKRELIKEIRREVSIFWDIHSRDFVSTPRLAVFCFAVQVSEAPPLKIRANIPDPRSLYISEQNLSRDDMIMLLFNAETTFFKIPPEEVFESFFKMIALSLLEYLSYYTLL